MRTAAPPGEDDHPGPTAGPPLRVRLLGELDLRLGNDPLPPLRSARARSLLAYLLLHDDTPHGRQRLAFLLWPDSTEGQARTNLRNVLHTLRHTSPELAPFLELTSQTVRWRGDGRCWVDAAALMAAAEDADRAAPGSDEELRALRAAADLYRGDLLEGCYDEWVGDARERLRDRHLSILRRLTERLAHRGEHAEATRWARALLRGDPLDEDAYRLLMGLHDHAGDRAGALRVYHQCVAVLHRELGVEPSPATKAAHAALMRDDGGSPAVATATAPPRVGGSALVGRTEEWAQVTGCWRDAEAGRAHVVLVTGEAGIGKTRLVEELAEWCAHRGALVAQARAYATEGELGYGLVMSWLRTPELAAQLGRADPADVAPLAGLVPELIDGPVAVAGGTDEAEQRRRLFDAVSRVLTGSSRPTMLVADDVQWSDAASLQLVHYLLRRQPTPPVLVVATARLEELDDDHPLTALVSGLRLLDRITEVRLDRLTRSDTGDLAAQLHGAELDPASVEALHAETEGNPLFVVETVRAGWDGAGRSPATVSPRLLAVIGARLGQLSEPARHVLGVAATVGRSFTARLVGRAAGLDDMTFVRAVDELWRRGLIREHDVDAYDFSHGKIREAAYDALGPAVRRHTHLVLAEALAELAGSDADAASGQIAAHLELAGRADEAITWYRRAALQAQRVYAYDEALRLLDRARALVPALPEAVRLDRELDVLSLLPTALIGEGFASDRLAETQRRAAEVSAVAGVDLGAPFLRSLVMSSLCRDDFADAGAAAERLRAAAERDGDAVLVTESDYLLGIAAFWAADHETARARFEAVVDRFSPGQRTEHLLRFGQDPMIVCLSRLANVRWFLGDADGARAARAEATRLADELGHPYTLGVTHVFGGLLALDLDEPDELRRHAVALRTDVEHPRPVAIKALAFAGCAEALAGRPTGVADVRAAWDACGPRNHAPGFRAALLRVLLAALAAGHDPEAGLDAADAAIALGGTRIWEPEARRLRAEFLAALDRPAAEVRDELERAAEVARVQGAPGPAARVERTRRQLGL